MVLPDGSHMTRADLPSKSTTRWVASRKSAVVRGVASGLISRVEACDLYDLSTEELDSWCAAAAHHGVKALRTTALQKYRQV